jgi:hypothetical protein
MSWPWFSPMRLCTSRLSESLAAHVLRSASITAWISASVSLPSYLVRLIKPHPDSVSQQRVRPGD